MPEYLDNRFALGYTTTGDIVWKDHKYLVQQWCSVVTATARLLAAEEMRQSIGPFTSSDLLIFNAIRKIANKKIAQIKSTQNSRELMHLVTGSDHRSWVY